MENLLDPTPRRIPYSTDKACAAFNYDFSNPRPPEPPRTQKTPDEHVDTSPFPLDDPVQTSLLIQMFLSELQEASTPSAPLGSEAKGDVSAALDIQVEAEPEFDFSSGVSSSISRSKSCLECNPKTTSSTIYPLLSPLDDPFFSNFTDISLLEGALLPLEDPPFLCVNSYSPSSMPSSVSTTSDPVSLPSSPVVVDVQTVVSSSSCEKTADQGIFDLSECVDLLTDKSTSTSLIPSRPISSSSSSSCYSPLSSPPSTTASSPMDSMQVSFLLDDLDFSAISGQDLESVVSSCADISNLKGKDLTSLDSVLSPEDSGSLSHTRSSFNLPTPSSPSHSNHVSTTTEGTRKRKQSSSDDSLPTKICRISSEPSSTTATEQLLPSVEKCKIRRDRNNLASVVSRAKRRQRHKELQRRAEELETANEELREKVEELVAETETLRNLLLHKLTQH